MAILLRCEGAVGAVVGEGDDPMGLYLKSFDPDFEGGLGRADWTDNLDEAMSFESLTEAMVCWKKSSTVQPYRADGKPNRPLTAYSVSTVTKEGVPK